ncbi:MAG: hypothetical protein BGO07_01185 [Alphaproteobacteria bacterium 40-19]|nr:MAG: hypothetical protein BGO07_01185 [Alphaproteobacteria bacterium 40-19]
MIENKKNVKMDARYILCAGLLLIGGYLGYHGMYGRRGYMAWKQQRTIFLCKKDSVEKMERLKTRLLSKVQLMKEAVDPDLLEQLAFKVLRRLDSQKSIIIYDMTDQKRP